MAATLAATAALLAAPARAADQADPAPLGVQTVRVAADSSSLAWIKNVAEAYEKRNPHVTVEVRYVSPLLSCGQLAAGDVDLIAVYGGDDIYKYVYEYQRGKLASVGEAFKPGELTSHLLGRHAMAIVVSPTSTLNEVTAVQMSQLIANACGQKVADPFADLGMAYVADSIFGQDMRIRIAGSYDIGRRQPRKVTGDPTAWFRPGPLLEKVAGDDKLMAFMRLDDHVWASGVKVLPVRIADGRAVLPTPENVMDGSYPYYCSLMLVVPAKASPAAKDVADFALDPQRRRWLAPYWITPQTPQPGKPQRTVWPAPAGAGDAPAESDNTPRHPASAAVLPVEQLSVYFRLADKAVQARYEDDLSAGIARAGGTTLVDRAQLRRVLAERKASLLARRAKETQPIVAADVIVLGRVISRQTVTYLRIEAFHSGTASCLGLVELPIDPARPAEFDPPLEDLAAKWWPGVLANLARAHKGPVWTLTGQDESFAEPAGADARAALEKTLASAEGIFFARYSYLPAAQREMMLRLMGLSRAAGRVAVAADYIVTLGEDGGKVKVGILRGADAKELAAKSFADGGGPAWLAERIAALAGERAAADDPAKAQAQREFELGMAVKKQIEKLQAEAYARYRAAKRDDYLPEDQARLAELARQMDRHFERAMQLDPAAEEAAIENIKALAAKTRDYPTFKACAEASLEFIDRFPRSRKIGLAFEKGDVGLTYLYGFLGSSENLWTMPYHVPQGIERQTLALEYRRRQLSLLAAAVMRAGNKPEGGYGGLKSRAEYAKDYEEKMGRYAAVASPAEFDDAIGEYARACDALPAQALHSDFLRLRYMARRGEKREYLDLLADMQRRWADPNGNRWKLGGEQTSREMCELFRMDPRRSSLYQWLKGRRGPGDLPYAGYQAATQPATAPAGAAPARR
jgi:hypothetical protein